MNNHVRKSMNYRRASLFFLGTITLIVVGAALKMTSQVLLPFIIAVLLTFVLEPLVTFLVKLKIPRAIAAIAIVFFVGVGVYALGLILFNSLKTIVSLYPKYEARFTEIYETIALAFDLSYDEHETLFNNLWNELNIRIKIQAFAFRFSESFIAFLRDVMMVVLFIVFLLLEIGHFRKRAEIAFEKILRGGMSGMIDSIVLQITRYLSIKFFLSLATGIVVGLILRLIGLDFPLVWGVIVFIMNFIPTLGSIAAGGGIILFSIVQFYPDPGPIVATMILMLASNFVIGNILEPKIQGDHLGLSPFVILVSLLGWGWLWGFAGLILAVPMTVIVKIICEHTPGLEPVSIMLGSYKAAAVNTEEES